MFLNKFSYFPHQHVINAWNWPGPVNIMFSSGICPNSFLALDMQQQKTCRLTFLFHGIWFLSCVITCSDSYPLSNQIILFMLINKWGKIIKNWMHLLFLKMHSILIMNLKYACQQYFTYMCFLGFIRYNKTFIAYGFRKYENLFTHEYHIWYSWVNKFSYFPHQHVINAWNWPGPVNIMLSSGFCPNSFLALNMQQQKTCRLTDLQILSIIYLNTNSIIEYIIINIYVKYARLYQQQIHFSHLQQVQCKGKSPFNTLPDFVRIRFWP
jgi:hypothetical protein